MAGTGTDTSFKIRNTLVVNSAFSVNSTGLYFSNSFVSNATFFAGQSAFVNTTGNFNVSGNLTINAALVADNTSGSLGQVLMSANTYTYWQTLATSATTDTTNASNITTGTLGFGMLPANVVSNAQLSANLTNYLSNYPTSVQLTNNLANYPTSINLTNNLANYQTLIGMGSYQTIAGLSSNVATLGYQTMAGLSSNVATLTANNSTNLGGTIASGYQTTAGLSSNVATLTANNSTNFNSQAAAYYTNATNISTGTLNISRLPTSVLSVPPTNRISNGGMDIWQRGTTFTVTTAAAYTADRWIVLPTGASVTVAQLPGRLLTVNSLQITGAASVTDVIIKQRIESYIAAAMTSQQVTFQAWVYNGTGGSITPTLTIKHPTAQDDYTSTGTDISAVSLQACGNAAWTQISYTFTAGASSALGMEVSIDFGNNFSTAGKSVKITECDLKVTPGISSGLNSSPPVPQFRCIDEELLLCQRYYYIYPNLVRSYIRAQEDLSRNFTYLYNMRATPYVSCDYHVEGGGNGTINSNNNSSDFYGLGPFGVTVVWVFSAGTFYTILNFSNFLANAEL